MADPCPQHAPVGRGTERADVPGMRRCCRPLRAPISTEMVVSASSLHYADAVCATASERGRSGQLAAGVHPVELRPICCCAEWPTHAHSTRQSVVALKRLMCLAWYAVLWQLLWSERRSQMRRSGSGFGASRSGIASTDSDGS